MSGVTLREMEEVAMNFGDMDLGNVIDITDANDNLGLNMLMNPTKTITVNTGSQNTPSTGGQGMSEIEVTSFDSPPPITLNMGTPQQGMQAPLDIEIKREESPFSNQQSASGPSISLSPPVSRQSQEDEKKEKIEYLNKLQRLEQKGFPVSRRYTMDNGLDEMKQEYMRLLDARNLEASLRFQRQAMIGVVTGMEWLNGRFDPFDLKLDGWSESVHENVEDFDEIFEELYDKYKDRGKMPPELRLMTALAGSGFMCHVSNTFLKSRMPSADDVLRNNPDLARQFAAATAQQAGPGFGNFMGMAMGQTQSAQPAQPAPRQTAGPTGAFFQSSQPQQMRSPQAVPQAEQQSQQPRREMRGPSNVDDILRTFEEARKQELNEIPPSNGSQAAVAAAVEIQSMHSDDLQSAAESTRTGRTGGGRRRRVAVGNTVSLPI
jgi:Family of unknown function (DUF5767)